MVSTPYGWYRYHHKLASAQRHSQQPRYWFDYPSANIHVKTRYKHEPDAIQLARHYNTTSRTSHGYCAWEGETSEVPENHHKELYAPKPFIYAIQELSPQLPWVVPCSCFNIDFQSGMLCPTLILRIFNVGVKSCSWFPEGSSHRPLMI
eukprot:jgi/Botrbrau1/19889/Bobra.0059s0010.1